MPRFSASEAKRILDSYGTIHHELDKSESVWIECWYLMTNFGHPMGGLRFGYRNHHLLLAEVERRMLYHVGIYEA